MQLARSWDALVVTQAGPVPVPLTDAPPEGTQRATTGQHVRYAQLTTAGGPMSAAFLRDEGDRLTVLVELEKVRCARRAAGNAEHFLVCRTTTATIVHDERDHRIAGSVRCRCCRREDELVVGRLVVLHLVVRIVTELGERVVLELNRAVLNDQLVS